jgi:hypothetical protein
MSNFTYTYFPTTLTRVQAHINTDKPIYHPNELVFIEVFILNIFNKTPVATNTSTSTNPLYNLYFQIYGPTNSIVY